MAPTPKTPSPAYLRFKASMIIDYGKWRDGEPYDIAALGDVTQEERSLLTDEICENGSLDWRDVEALRALGTTKAIARVGKAAERQNDGGGAEALLTEIEAGGWNAASEQRVVDMLEHMESMTGASDRLFEICEQHQTPAILKQLLRNARIQSDPTMRYSSGAFLLYLAGHVDSRYVFDADHRPRLLELNSDDYKTYKSAIAWLEDKIAHPKKA